MAAVGVVGVVVGVQKDLLYPAAAAVAMAVAVMAMAVMAMAVAVTAMAAVAVMAVTAMAVAAMAAAAVAMAVGMEAVEGVVGDLGAKRVCRFHLCTRLRYSLACLVFPYKPET